MRPKTVKEISEYFGVTPQTVGNWIKVGLPYGIEKIIGRKPRRIINQEDVYELLGLSKDFKSPSKNKK